MSRRNQPMPSASPRLRPRSSAVGWRIWCSTAAGRTCAPVSPRPSPRWNRAQRSRSAAEEAASPPGWLARVSFHCRATGSVPSWPRLCPTANRRVITSAVAKNVCDKREIAGQLSRVVEVLPRSFCPPEGGGLGCSSRPPGEIRRLERLASAPPVAGMIPRVIIVISLFRGGGTGAAEVAPGRETDMDLPDSAAGTVRRRGWARTGPRSRVIRGKTPGSYGRSSPGAQSRSDCAARPGRRDLAGPAGPRGWTCWPPSGRSEALKRDGDDERPVRRPFPPRTMTQR
jgi:hypothetical protein